MKRRAVVVVGGGLAGSLAAYRLAQQRADVDVTLLEQGAALGASHTWCCHGSDLSATASWVTALTSCRWDTGYEVRFPDYQRTVTGSYVAIRSQAFSARVAKVLGTRVRLQTAVRSVQAKGVELASGEHLAADCVVDARGAVPEALGPVAYQKFYGLFVRTERPHGLSRPILMDATVEQLDGFRFVYVLPFNEHELLVEDTRYSDSAHLDKAAMAESLRAYLTGQGFAAWSCTGDEAGVLPIPLHGATAPTAPAGIITAGVRAGLFHPTTGYSLPEAVQFADWLATAGDLASPDLPARAAARAAAVWRRGAFCRRLNNMMFIAAAPMTRRRIMAQFYRRNAAVIGRFYSNALTQMDQLRLVSGRPPVSISAGVKAFFAKAAVG